MGNALTSSVAFTNSNAAIRSINPELEDAVRILGGSRFTAIWRVVTRARSTTSPSWTVSFASSE